MNPRPLEPQSRALPTELRPPSIFYLPLNKQRQSVIYRQTFVKDMGPVGCKLFDDSKVAAVAFALGFGFLGRFTAGFHRLQRGFSGFHHLLSQVHIFWNAFIPYLAVLHIGIVNGPYRVKGQVAFIGPAAEGQCGKNSFFCYFNWAPEIKVEDQV